MGSKKGNSGCFTGGIAFIAIVYLLASVGAEGAKVVVILIILAVIIGFGVALVNSFKSTTNTKPRDYHNLKHNRNSKSIPEVVDEKPKQRPHFGSHSLSKEHRYLEIYEDLVAVIKKYQQLAAKSDRLIATQDKLRKEEETLKQERANIEKYKGKSIFQSKQKYRVEKQSRLDIIQKRLYEIQIEGDRVSAEVSTVSIEIRTLKYTINDEMCSEFKNLSSVYSTWVKSDRIDGSPSVSELSTIKNKTRDYSLIKSEINPLFFNVGNYCFCCYPSMVLLYESNGFFIDAYTPACISPKGNVKQVNFWGTPPHDAVVLGYRWEHACRDGSRDMRYKSNSQLTFTKFGVLDLVLAGYTLSYDVSNFKSNTKFVDALKAYSERNIVRKPSRRTEPATMKTATITVRKDKQNDDKRNDIDSIIKRKYT